MFLDVQIDKLTDCLVEHSTGKLVETEYKLHHNTMTPKEYKNWKYNWSQTQTNGYDVYELFVKGNKVVQGRISIKMDGGVANIDIAETAPHNFGHDGVYEGVGGHLFAIACQISLEHGCDGVVAFDSKSDLVEYYKAILGAVEIYPRRLVIFEKEAQKLISKYIRK